jgi:hypothetical protein
MSAIRVTLNRTTKSFNMHNEIGPIVLGVLSAVFAAYGIRELAFAYRTPKLQEWSGRALPAAGSVLL